MSQKINHASDLRDQFIAGLTQGTPVEDYQGILVHDHEKTFYNYGTDHQECLAHVQRYLKNSIQNESEKTWSQLMRLLIQKMIHYRNTLPVDTEIDASIVDGFE